MIEGPTNTPKGPERLKAYEDNWQTEMGAWFPGERVVLRGKDLFTEFENHSWMEFFLYAVTGRDSPLAAKVIEGIWLISSSYPDPRLWNNRIAALAGTSRSTAALAIAAGNAASEASLYGLRTSRGALDFLKRADEKLEAGIPLEAILKNELKKYRAIYGYGRPLVNEDERIAPLIKFVKTTGLKEHKYLSLALLINDYFQASRYKLQINISAIAAAVAADFGLSIDEFYHLATLSFVGGLFPCYIDSKNKPEGAFFPLRVDRIKSSSTQTKRTWIPKH
ncbi:MAG: hypothetical protein JKX92_00415 [Porticoccaceae bacterium]|nr:hypothetical protein [Porticoccaceae bacterium]